ncbi:hypothetical protein M514_22453 [Trichuris suis]|uniref:Uncharacterized protein n=1 Tax=Trichuris suis TaxID=68888 RepID=A0A085N7G7_9BILA|nr:hypothetical protein M514_22453 [Trichuris suis]
MYTFAIEIKALPYANIGDSSRTDDLDFRKDTWIVKSEKGTKRGRAENIFKTRTPIGQKLEIENERSACRLMRARRPDRQGKAAEDAWPCRALLKLLRSEDVEGNVKALLLGVTSSLTFLFKRLFQRSYVLAAGSFQVFQRQRLLLRQPKANVEANQRDELTLQSKALETPFRQSTAFRSKATRVRAHCGLAKVLPVYWFFVLPPRKLILPASIPDDEGIKEGKSSIFFLFDGEGIVIPAKQSFPYSYIEICTIFRCRAIYVQLDNFQS